MTASVKLQTNIMLFIPHSERCKKTKQNCVIPPSKNMEKNNKKVAYSPNWYQHKLDLATRKKISHHTAPTMKIFKKSYR